MPAMRLTIDVHKTIVDAMRIGSYITTAARLAGVSDSALRKWLKRGREDIADGHFKTPYAKLVFDIERAEASAEVRAVGVIQQAARNGDWRAASWWLSHRFPDRWSDRISADLTITEMGSDEFAEAVAEIVAAFDEDD